MIEDLEWASDVVRDMGICDCGDATAALREIDFVLFSTKNGTLSRLMERAGGAYNAVGYYLNVADLISLKYQYLTATGERLSDVLTAYGVEAVLEGAWVSA